MTQLLLILTPIGLIDSVSITPIACVPLLALLGSPRPLRNSLAFLSGISIPYYVFGVVAMVGLASIFERLNEWFQRFLRNPDTADLVLEGVLGLVMLYFGAKLALEGESQAEEQETSGVSATQSFSFGFFLTVIGMPGALPYFAAMDQLLRADVDLVSTLLALLYYNVIFILPLASIVVLRLALGTRSDAFFQRLADFLGRWAQRLLIAALLLLGMAMVVDAAFFLAGHPLFTYEDVFGAD